jgi:hypothetical protein
MRLNDPGQQRSRAPLIWSLWLLDLVYAVHLDLAVNCFSPTELWTKMPSSTYEFQELYSILICEDGESALLPADLVAPEDAMLLLMAILSDYLFIHRSLGWVVDVADSGHSAKKRRPNNPFLPLSPRRERDRVYGMLSSALDKWWTRFQSCMTPEVMAFYCYCRLHLSCPQLLELPCLAGYKPMRSTSTMNDKPIAVSDEATRLAWQCLDLAAARSKKSSPHDLCPVWLPVVVFHAALLIWAKQDPRNDRNNSILASLKVLLAFKMELDGMHWPCCAEMSTTLERLMDPSTLN